jgi:hypothetical protein
MVASTVSLLLPAAGRGSGAGYEDGEDDEDGGEPLCSSRFSWSVAV